MSNCKFGGLLNNLSDDELESLKKYLKLDTIEDIGWDYKIRVPQEYTEEEKHNSVFKLPTIEFQFFNKNERIKAILDYFEQSGNFNNFLKIFGENSGVYKPCINEDLVEIVNNINVSSKEEVKIHKNKKLVTPPYGPSRHKINK